MFYYHFGCLCLKIGYCPICTLVLLITNETHRCKRCPNFASFEVFMNRNTGLHLLTNKSKQTRTASDTQLVDRNTNVQ